VLVAASPDAERLIKKNNLTLAELFKPLGANLEGIGCTCYLRDVIQCRLLTVASRDLAAVSFRTVNRSVNLRNFSVRFVSAAEFNELDPKVSLYC